MKILIILLALQPLSTHAIFQKIYRGYLGSTRLKAILIEEAIYSADYQFGVEKNDWSLSIGAQTRDTFLQSLFSFQSQKTITKTSSIGLKKSSYKFGTFTFENRITDYDLSKWAVTSLNALDSDTVYEYRNTLGYSYEILNKSTHLDWEILNAQHETDKVNHSLKLQTDFYDFYRVYADAKLNIILDGLYKDFERRAVKRVKQVKKRIKDGLSRKLELHQSRISLLNQQETILKNTNNLRQKIAIIEDIIGVKIPASDYKKLKWTYKKKESFPQILHPKKFPELERLKRLNIISAYNIKRFEAGNSSSLSLNLSYTINAFNSSRQHASADAFGNANTDEKTIALNYTLPLGLSKRGAQKKKLIVDSMRNKLIQNSLKGALEVKTKVLLENLGRFEKAIKLSRKKITAANLSVREHQRLYLRGQVTFEELLRAEETYINAKISHVGILSLYDLSMGELAFLGGNIKSYLDNYID